jgi:hypothetical protein
VPRYQLNKPGLAKDARRPRWRWEDYDLDHTDDIDDHQNQRELIPLSPSSAVAAGVLDPFASFAQRTDGREEFLTSFCQYSFFHSIFSEIDHNGKLTIDSHQRRLDRVRGRRKLATVSSDQGPPIPANHIRPSQHECNVCILGSPYVGSSRPSFLEFNGRRI